MFFEGQLLSDFYHGRPISGPADHVHVPARAERHAISIGNNGEVKFGV